MTRRRRRSRRSALRIPRPSARLTAGGGRLLLSYCKSKEHVLIFTWNGWTGDQGFHTILDALKEVGPSLGFAYIGWPQGEEECDHSRYTKDHYHALDLSDELKQLIVTAVTGTGKLEDFGPPSGLVVSYREGMLELTTHNAISRILDRGAKACPWSDEIEAKLEAEDAARVASLGESQKQLRFLQGETGQLIRSPAHADGAGEVGHPLGRPI